MNKKIKIVAFARSLPIHIKGGMEFHFFDLICELNKYGFKITVITTKHPAGIKYEKINGVEFFYLEDTLCGKYQGGFWRKSFEKFKKLYLKNKYDVILSQSAGVYGYLKYNCKYNIPVMAILQGTSIGSIRSQIRESVKRVYLFLKVAKDIISYINDRRLLPKVDLLVCGSQTIYNDLIKFYPVQKNKCIVINNSVNIEKFYNLDKQELERIKIGINIKRDDKVLLYCGRLTKGKGVHILIKSFYSIIKEGYGNKYKLVIVGTGKYKEVLEKLVHKLNIENNVIFTGYIDKSKIPFYYKLASIYIIPSIGEEGLSLSLLDAMAAGLPIIATDIKSNKGVIVHKKSGLIVKRGSVDELYKGLKFLLNNKSEVVLYSKNSTVLVKKFFFKDYMIKQYAENLVALSGLNSEAN